MQQAAPFGQRLEPIEAADDDGLVGRGGQRRRERAVGGSAPARKLGLARDVGRNPGRLVAPVNPLERLSAISPEDSDIAADRIARLGSKCYCR